MNSFNFPMSILSLCYLSCKTDHYPSINFVISSSFLILSQFPCLKGVYVQSTGQHEGNKWALEYRYHETWHVYSRHLHYRVRHGRFCWECRLCHNKFLAICRFQKWEKVWEGVGGYFRTLYRKGEEEDEGGVVRCEWDNQMPDEVMLRSVTTLLQLFC